MPKSEFHEVHTRSAKLSFIRPFQHPSAPPFIIDKTWSLFIGYIPSARPGDPNLELTLYLVFKRGVESARVSEMREILYIQAGRLANYTGTHFWNCQEKYFTYDDETETLVDHDISFREGLDAHGSLTYCPRLLMFDIRGEPLKYFIRENNPPYSMLSGNFGRLSSANSLYGYSEAVGDPSDGSDPYPAVWGGEVVSYAQEPISSPPSGTRMTSHNAVRSNNSSDVYTDNDLHIDRGHQKESDEILFWSDFARVSYIPRTIQKVPETSDWDKSDGDWNIGQDAYEKYNNETGLMEGAVRLFLEECDSPQGLQIIEDTTSFGSFVHSFITSFHDEFSKLPMLTFPLLSDSVPSVTSGPRDLKRMINDAQVLRGFDEIHSSTCIPIQRPSEWHDVTSSEMAYPHDDYYLSSAVLCSHLETSTLPLRLKNSTSSLTMSSLLAHLNWRGTTRFSHLSGISMSNASESFDNSLPLSDFSLPAKLKSDLPTQYACLNVTRGFSEEDLLVYDRRPSACPVKNIHAPGYPFNEGLSSFSTPRSSAIPSLSETARLLTETQTTSGTAQLFAAYARAIQGEIAHGSSDVARATGLDVDELKELVNDLWRMHDDDDDLNDLDLELDDE